MLSKSALLLRLSDVSHVLKGRDELDSPRLPLHSAQCLLEIGFFGGGHCPITGIGHRRHDKEFQWDKQIVIVLSASLSGGGGGD